MCQGQTSRVPYFLFSFRDSLVWADVHLQANGSALRSQTKSNRIIVSRGVLVQLPLVLVYIYFDLRSNSSLFDLSSLFMMLNYWNEKRQRMRKLGLVFIIKRNSIEIVSCDMLNLRQWIIFQSRYALNKVYLRIEFLSQSIFDENLNSWLRFINLLTKAVIFSSPISRGNSSLKIQHFTYIRGHVISLSIS